MNPLFQEDWELGEGLVRIAVLSPSEFLEGTARISHFIENPVFQGEQCTLQEIQDYWSEQRGLLYESLFFGSNFSAADVHRFSATFPEGIRNHCESWFVRQCNASRDLYFSILRFPESGDARSLFQCELTLKHELSHALYYLEPEYRKLIHEMWNFLPGYRQEEIYDRYSHFYASHRVIDEWAAHILASFEWEQLNDLSGESFLQLKRKFWDSLGRKRYLETISSLNRSILLHYPISTPEPTGAADVSSEAS